MKAIIPLVMILILAFTASAWAVSYFQFGDRSQPILCEINHTVYKTTQYDCDYKMGRKLMQGEKVTKPPETGTRMRPAY